MRERKSDLAAFACSAATSAAASSSFCRCSWAHDVGYIGAGHAHPAQFLADIEHLDALDPAFPPPIFHFHQEGIEILSFQPVLHIRKIQLF